MPPPHAPDPRGRRAGGPLAIPRLGWRDVLLRVRRELAEDNLSLIAAGVAFYFMLAIFPGLIATVSIWGLFADPATMEEQLGRLLRLMPRQAGDLVAGQLHEIAAASGTGLGLSALVSLGLALGSAAKGARALIAGLNIAYDESEKRSALRLQLMALLFTVGFIAFVSLSLTVITALPALLARLPLGPAGRAVAFTLTWTAQLLLMLGGLALVYRYAPSRNQPRWRWVGVGSLAATLLWLVASTLFSWYAAHFAQLNETYGTLAGGVLLMLWLQITAFVTLLGAELNAESEHQTAIDSTEGPPKPMGRRHATVADTLGGAFGHEVERHEQGRSRRGRRDQLH